jgi:DNA helicase HerA-like ATPase
LRAYLGRLREDNSKFYVDLDKFLEAHVSILSKTGQGKSYAVGVLIEELAKNNIPVLIIDPHGEYRSMISPNDDRRSELFHRFGIIPKGLSRKIRIYSNKEGDLKFTLPGNRLRVKDVESLYQGKLKDSHKEKLHQIMFESGKSNYDIDGLIAKAGELEGHSKFTLISILHQIKSLGILSNRPTKPTDLVKKRRVTILDLNPLPRQFQRTIVASVLDSLWMARKSGEIPAFVLVVEESHIFAPQVKSVVSSEILKDIAAEGRKFGICLVVVTQRPSRINKDVLSQPQVQIYLKVTSPNDVKAIYESIENVTPGLKDELIALKKGQCIISGVDEDKPLKVDIRVRRTKHGGKSQRFGE